MSTNLVSVLIPIHGDAPYLKNVLESIRYQELVAIELVVVLDRPSPSLKIQVESSLENMKMTKILVSPGSGISEALNFGLSHCLGNYVARIDSDDEMTKDRLIKQRQFLDNNPKINCVGTQIIKISEKNTVIGKSRYPSNLLVLNQILRIRNCVAHPSVMYRRDEVLKIGGYRTIFDGTEDYDLWIRFSRKRQIANLDEFLTRYRIWNSQDSAKYLDEKNIRAHQVRLFSELEEIAPEYASELVTKQMDVDSLMANASKYMRENSPCRLKRLSNINELNIFLICKNNSTDIKSAFVIFLKILHILLLTFSIRITDKIKYGRK
jgi:glycosyltransferase involved in cell wall biosynthesis